MDNLNSELDWKFKILINNVTLADTNILNAYKNFDENKSLLDEQVFKKNIIYRDYIL